MSRLFRAVSDASAVQVAAIVFAGAIVGSGALGLAARAYASPCDPLGIAMTPQPVLSCASPAAAPPTEGAPAPGPVDNVAAPPPPGQPPYVPPVADGDSPPPLSQLDYLREIWNQFHNGVPTELLYGPAPADAPPPAPPEGPLPPPLIP